MKLLIIFTFMLTTCLSFANESFEWVDSSTSVNCFGSEQEYPRNPHLCRLNQAISCRLMKKDKGSDEMGCYEYSGDLYIQNLPKKFCEKDSTLCVPIEIMKLEKFTIPY